MSGTYDLQVSAAALRAAAAWVCDGEDMAPVELVADDRMLVVRQGDELAAFDTGGEPASDDYLAVAPIDGKVGDNRPLTVLLRRIQAEAGDVGEGVPWEGGDTLQILCIFFAEQGYDINAAAPEGTVR